MRKRRWLALAMAAVMTTSSVPAEFLTAYADEYDYEETQDALYPVGIQILAIDRFHLLSDMINCITNELHLSIGSLSTTTADCIVQCTIHFSVHSFGELQTIISQVAAINGVEEVKRI